MSAASGPPGDGSPAAGAVWVLEPRQEGLVVRLHEFWRYRKILWFFTTRAVRRTYEGTLLGKLWLLRPVIPIAIGAMVFGGLLGVPSEGLPYFLFYLVGSIAWMLFEQSALMVTRSLDMSKGLVKKVYFPRLVVPVASVSPALVYFILFLLFLLATFVYYFITQGRWYLVIGVQTLMAFVSAALCVLLALAIGLWTSVWQTRFRDVRFTLRYVLRFWGYLTPVIYPVAKVPAEYRHLMLFNPMAAYVETFKWGLLGTGAMDSTALATAIALTLAVLFTGAWYFTREEARAIDSM